MRRSVSRFRDRPLGAATLALGLALLLLAARARAEGGEERLSVHPSVRVTGEWSDNALLAPDDSAEGDWGVWVEPRLELGWERARLRTRLDLGADLRRYRTHPGLDQELWRVSGLAELGLTRHWRLELRDDWLPRAVRLGRPGDAAPNRVQTNRAEVALLWQREIARHQELSFSLRSAWFASPGVPTDVDTDGDGEPDAVRDADADHRELRSHLEWQRALGRHTSAYVRGEARQRSFASLDEADFTELAVYTGLRSRRTRNLELDGALGWGRLDFDHGRSRGRVLARGRARWESEGSSRFDLVVGRQFTSDVTGQEYTETNVRLEGSRALGRRTRIGAALLASQFDGSAPGAPSNRFTGVQLHVERQLRRRLGARVALRHWRNAGRDANDDFEQNRITLELFYAR